MLRSSAWRRNQAVNAVVMPLYDYGRKAIADGLPDGPFRGVPFLLKDLGGWLAGVRVTACSVLIPPSPSPAYGAIVLRDRVGFRPTIPQHEAGARIEPNPSEACAMGRMRAPAAAAAPPLEPPEIRVVSHGFFVGP